MRALRHCRSSRRALIVFAVSTTALAIAAGIAYATIPDSNGLYTACVLKSTGTIRLIDPSLGTTSLMGHCTSLETQITWNQKGQQGPTGPAGTDGVSVTSTALQAGDVNCPTGGSRFTSASADTYACNGAKGDRGGTGAQGPQGPKGDQGPPGALATLDSVNGLPCARSGQAGSAQIAYDPSGVVTITCVVSGTPPTTVPSDGINNTFGSAINLGDVRCGQSVVRNGTTSPADTSDWFEVSFDPLCPVRVSFSADAGIKFDLVGADGSTLQSGLTSSIGWGAPNPILIRVYGDPGVTGYWNLMISTP